MQAPLPTPPPLLLTQAEFDARAAAWTRFIDAATPNEVQQLFQVGGARQAFVSFDLFGTIAPLLSTVGLARVMVRFVLHPAASAADPDEAARPAPARFGLVLYATNPLGGRISAYYLPTGYFPAGEAAPTPTEQLGATDAGDAAPAGQVPFSLVQQWVAAWANAPQLSSAMFATPYGPLQGYSFELSDFSDLVFWAKPSGTAPTPQALRVIFDLKTYYPAYPENPAQPTQTFGLVLRLFPFVDSSGGDGGGLGDPPKSGGPSYDMSMPIPPGSQQ